MGGSFAQSPRGGGRARTPWPGSGVGAASILETMADVAEPVEAAVEPLPLRFFGDQVLRRVAGEVTDIDGELVELAERMLETMDEANGVALAAPQVGRSVRMFVHALGEQAPAVLINPEIVASDGEWTYS